MALAMRMDQVFHRWLYVIMGDGEQDEGNVWEAAMLAAKYKLNNIIAITDRNNIQIDGPTEQVMPLEDLKAKWESFGWHVMAIDGNNMETIIDTLAMARAIVDKPVMIIAYTIPGKGVGYMEYDYHWHGAPPGIQDVPGDPPKADQAKIALHELRTLRGKIRGEHE
jgi:transketolase